MAELAFPDPPLSAGALALRAWTAADVPAVVAACQDPAIARFAAAVPAPYSEADARAWFASQEPARRAGLRLELAIANATTDGLLGSIVLSGVERVHGRAMVSFWVLRSRWVSKGRRRDSVVYGLLAEEFPGDGSTRATQP